MLALLVTFLWSTSFIITKWVYAAGVGPLTLSGLRYSLAALVLFPFWWLERRRAGVSAPAAAPAPEPGATRWGIPWFIPLLLGLTGYTLTQGGQNIGLYYPNATQVSLILGIHNNLQVLLWSALLMREWPTRLQGLAIVGALGGVLLYYYPWDLGVFDFLGVLPVLAAGVGYALWIVGNRRFVRGGSALNLTWRSMSWGGGALLLLALVREGLPQLSPQALGWILVLAVANTALAFTLWTQSQRVLVAFESSIINNTMMIQIALLAYLLLGEPLPATRWAGIGVVALFTLLLNLAPHLERRYRGGVSPRGG